ncbi:MAG TPA: hypothetical protein VKQ36_09455 [Ktedonobacterales bacterium]|nr:hypothetical protein [Ktedonobacterales bacterium]
MLRDAGASGDQADLPNQTPMDDDDAYDDPFADFEDVDTYPPDSFAAYHRSYVESPTPPMGVTPPQRLSDADALAALATEADDGRDLAPAWRVQDERRPVVSASRWLAQESPEDVWRTGTMRAITGKRQAARPPQKKRTLPQPRRFRKPAPIRSGFLLIVTVALGVLALIGSIDLSWQAYHYIHTLQQPTTNPTHPKTPHPAPTTTPSS